MVVVFLRRWGPAGRRSRPAGGEGHVVDGHELAKLLTRLRTSITGGLLDTLVAVVGDLGPETSASWRASGRSDARGRKPSHSRAEEDENRGPRSAQRAAQQPRGGAGESPPIPHQLSLYGWWMRSSSAAERRARAVASAAISSADRCTLKTASWRE